jgi:hypothetical protein
MRTGHPWSTTNSLPDRSAPKARRRRHSIWSRANAPAPLVETGESRALAARSAGGAEDFLGHDLIVPADPVATGKLDRSHQVRREVLANGPTVLPAI